MLIPITQARLHNNDYYFNNEFSHMKQAMAEKRSFLCAFSAFVSSIRPIYPGGVYEKLRIQIYMPVSVCKLASVTAEGELGRQASVTAEGQKN